MNEVEKNMAVSALAQLLDQQPTAYAEVLAACRAMGWNASPTAQPADIIDELPSNVLPFIRRMLALLIYGDGSADSPAVVPVTDRCYAQMLARQASPNYPAAGFPSDRDPFTHAPSIRDFAHLEQALSALSPRKITNGNAENDGIADGMSLAHLMCSTDAWAAITELVDDNNGWLYDRPITFPANLTKLVLGMGTLRRTTSGSSLSFSGTYFAVPYLKLIDHSSTNNNVCFDIPNVEDVDAHSLSELQQHYSTAGQTLGQIFSGTNIKKIDTDLQKFQYRWNVDYYVFCPSPNLQFLKVGKLQNFQPTIFYYQGAYTVPNRGSQETFKKLIHFEIGAGTAISLNLSTWNPSYVLSDNPNGTDLIEEGSTAQNNLDQFLQNFRSHIALRLTSNGSGKTLTLSQAVYDAIKDETHLFVFDEGTMTIYAYLTNIKHWTVTK